MDLRCSLGSCLPSLLVLRVLVFYALLGFLFRFAFQLYVYARLLPAVSRSLVNNQ